MRFLKTFSLLFFVLSFFTSWSSVHRVNNTGADADFTSVQAAHDAASAGDTLYIEGSATTYGNLIISKELHLIGAGYFLGQNQDLQASPKQSNLSQVTLAGAASNSTLQGLVITYVFLLGNNTSISDVTISRNVVSGIYLSSSGTVSNFFINHNYLTAASNSYGAIQTVGAGSKTLVIANNLIVGNSWAYLSIPSNTTATIINNTFAGGSLNSISSNYQNNILLAGSVLQSSVPNNSYSNNVGIGTNWPSGNGNVNNVTASSICNGYPSQGAFSSDARFELASGSQAIGAGISGEDCGAFGGNLPYILSGIPPIPTIYRFVSPALVNSNFNVTISTRSNN